MAYSLRYPAIAKELFLVGDGTYVEQLYRALKHAGVTLVEQFRAIGSLGSICPIAAILVLGMTKLVAFIGCNDPKYVVGEMTSICG